MKSRIEIVNEIFDLRCDVITIIDRMEILMYLTGSEWFIKSAQKVISNINEKLEDLQYDITKLTDEVETKDE